MLEYFCDRLHGQVERNLDEFLDPNILDKAPFYLYRDAMKTLASSTKQFYSNMIEGIEELDWWLRRDSGPINTDSVDITAYFFY